MNRFFTIAANVGYSEVISLWMATITLLISSVVSERMIMLSVCTFLYFIVAIVLDIAVIRRKKSSNRYLFFSASKSIIFVLISQWIVEKTITKTSKIDIQWVSLINLLMALLLVVYSLWVVIFAFWKIDMINALNLLDSIQHKVKFEKFIPEKYKKINQILKYLNDENFWKDGIDLLQNPQKFQERVKLYSEKDISRLKTCSQILSIESTNEINIYKLISWLITIFIKSIIAELLFLLLYCSINNSFQYLFIFLY